MASRVVFRVFLTSRGVAQPGSAPALGQQPAESRPAFSCDPANSSENSNTSQQVIRQESPYGTAAHHQKCHAECHTSCSSRRHSCSGIFKASTQHAGQALRGSSEFHAWGDSNLYLRRIEDRLLLSIEHRAAPSQTGLPLALTAVDDALALHIVDATPLTTPPPLSPVERLEHVLARADRPLTFAELRQACRLRTAHVCQAVATLTTQGRVHKTTGGYQLATSSRVSHDPFPDTPIQPPGNGNG